MFLLGSDPPADPLYSIYSNFLNKDMLFSLTENEEFGYFFFWWIFDLLQA
jgi:hypothetical protein